MRDRTQARGEKSRSASVRRAVARTKTRSAECQKLRDNAPVSWYTRPLNVAPVSAGSTVVSCASLPCFNVTGILIWAFE